MTTVDKHVQENTEMDVPSDEDIEEEELVTEDDSNASAMSDDEPEDEPESSDEGDDEGAKSGWADAMSKVLNTGKSSTSTNLLLTKAKKDYERPGVASTEETLEKSSAKRLHLKSKKNDLDAICRSKPDVVRDRTKERMLSKIATKGVVQLFNAVREQQKSLKVKLNVAGKSVTKREKVFKNIDKDAFMKDLDGTKSNPRAGGIKTNAKNSDIKPEIKEEEDESAWKVLRSDFMMGAKMKDWDKDSEESE